MQTTIPSLIFIFFISSCAKKRESFLIESEGTKLKVETITDSNRGAVRSGFLPDSRLLVTDQVDIEVNVVNLL